MTITVRHAEPGDSEAIQEIYAQAVTFENTLQLPYPSVEMWRQRLSEQDPGFVRLVACMDDRVVGEICLWTRPRSPARRHVGSIGMAVHEQWHRQGIGRTLLLAVIDLADRWLNLCRLELDVYTTNTAAIELYRSCGFEAEGTQPKFAFRDGRYVDALRMARITEGRLGPHLR